MAVAALFRSTVAKDVAFFTIISKDILPRQECAYGFNAAPPLR